MKILELKADLGYYDWDTGSNVNLAHCFRLVHATPKIPNTEPGYFSFYTLTEIVDKGSQLQMSLTCEALIGKQFD